MSLLRPRITVQPGTVVLAHDRDRPSVVLAPGRHRIRRDTRCDVVDLGERVTSVTGQDVRSEDGHTVRASMTVRWRVTDPVAFGERAAEHVAAVCLAAQVALREVVARLPAEAVAEAVRTASGDRVTVEVRPVAARVGVDVLGVHVTDVVLVEAVAGQGTG